jgi:hypothetical protein
MKRRPGTQPHTDNRKPHGCDEPPWTVLGARLTGQDRFLEDVKARSSSDMVQEFWRLCEQRVP